MATQDYPILTITADIPGVGTKTAELHMSKATVRPQIRTGLLVEDRFSQVSGVLAELAEDDKGSRKGVSVDAGGGQHIVEVDHELKTGADDQWGYTSDTSTSDAGTASGGDKIQKAQVFLNYLLHSSPDSFGPATLDYGMRASAGDLPPLDVTVEDPTFTLPRDEASTFMLSVTFVSTIDLGEAVTAIAREG